MPLLINITNYLTKIDYICIVVFSYNQFSGPADWWALFFVNNFVLFIQKIYRYLRCCYIAGNTLHKTLIKGFHI